MHLHRCPNQTLLDSRLRRRQLLWRTLIAVAQEARRDRDDSNFSIDRNSRAMFTTGASGDTKEMSSTIARSHRTSPYLVFTDLDGTLLDEQYRFDAALPAIEALRERSVPLVLASSKTLAEMVPLALSLNLTAPFIAENGGVIGFPQEVEIPGGLSVAGSCGDFRYVRTGISRDVILSVSRRLRRQMGFRFAGFADWSSEEVALRTGLSHAAADSASQRLATEPIIWTGTPAERTAFRRALLRYGIRMLRGGHFDHLMGKTDKSTGLRLLRKMLTVNQDCSAATIIALGDSQNDEEMLNAADVAVVLPSVRTGFCKLKPKAPRVIYATQPASHGWNAEVLKLLGRVHPGTGEACKAERAG